MDGLIHISELSWSHVNHPSEVLDIGQTVKVKVLDIDRDRQRISLGLKQTQSDPWQQVLDSYGEGDVVEGRVTKVVTFGAFVEILPGVEGLVHISELAEPPRREPARGRLAGRSGQRPHPRDRRRPPPALALAQARRGGRRAGAAGRRWRVRALDAGPEALGGGLPVERLDVLEDDLELEAGRGGRRAPRAGGRAVPRARERARREPSRPDELPRRGCRRRRGRAPSPTRSRAIRTRRRRTHRRRTTSRSTRPPEALNIAAPAADDEAAAEPEADKQ